MTSPALYPRPMPLAEVLMLVFIVISAVAFVAGVLLLARVLWRSLAEHREEIDRRS